MARSSPIVPDRKMNGTCGTISRASSSASMPSNPGIEKSDRIASGLASERATFMALSESTCRHSVSRPSRLRARSASWTSSAESSTKRRFTGASCVMLLLFPPYDGTVSLSLALLQVCRGTPRPCSAPSTKSGLFGAGCEQIHERKSPGRQGRRGLCRFDNGGRREAASSRLARTRITAHSADRNGLVYFAGCRVCKAMPDRRGECSGLTDKCP